MIHQIPFGQHPKSFSGEHLQGGLGIVHHDGDTRFRIGMNQQRIRLDNIDFRLEQGGADLQERLPALRKLNADQIEREADGTVVVVDGYQRTPVSEWAKQSLPAWMQKQPKPQGSGAPAGRSSGEIPAGIKNPFAPESFNLTEQSRLFRTDRDLYDRLKAAAGR